MKKPRPKRDKVKHASLKLNYNSKIRQEYLDVDYVNQLDDTVANCKLPNGKMVTEREYLALFMKEWNNAGVGSQANARKNAFQRTKAQVKDTTDRNNLRNNDLWGKMKAQNRGYTFSKEYLEAAMDNNREVNGINTVEEAMIDFLDNAKEFADSTDDGQE